MAGSFVFSSCATIVGGSKYNAHVDVLNRPKAKIYYNGEEKGSGYASFKVKRKEANMVSLTIKEEGQQDQIINYTSRTFRGGALVGTLLMWTGIIQGIPIPWGLAVDLATGALWKPNIHERGIIKEDYKNFRYIIHTPSSSTIANLENENVMEDVLYLINGSIVRGKIVEYGADYQVKIQIKGGSILVYREEEIEKITKEYINSKF